MRGHPRAVNPMEVGVTDSIAMEELPQDVKAKVQEIITEPNAITIERGESLPWDSDDSVGYYVNALQGDWYIRMMFDGRADPLVEQVETYRLSAIRHVEIKGHGHATVHIESEKGEFSTGVPEEIARALIKNG
jgi:hypothetical protein